MVSSRIFLVNAKDNQKARYRVCIYINFKLDILSYHVLLWLKNYSIQFALRQVSVETWLNVETVWSTFGLHCFCLIYATEWHKTNRIYPWNAKHYSTFHIIIIQYTSSPSPEKGPIGLVPYLGFWIESFTSFSFVNMSSWLNPKSLQFIISLMKHLIQSISITFYLTFANHISKCCFITFFLNLRYSLYVFLLFTF